MPNKIEVNELFIERLDDKHCEILKSFQCGEIELEKFLVEDALKNQRQMISVTYPWFLKETKELASYLTVSADSINLNSDLKEFFRGKDIYYKSLPALKIGRRAVDKRHTHKGIGTIMLEFVGGIAKQTYLEKAGCRFLVLDAKRNEDPKLDPLHFYKKFGFQILKERDKGTTAMYLDLYQNWKVLRL